MAELPAENGAAGQRETQSVGPEGVSSFLPMSPQDDSWSCMVEDAQTLKAQLLFYLQGHGAIEQCPI